jgi:putative DNA methylase
MNTAATKGGLAPFSLKDEPALIERVFPAQKVGAEAQKERKAGAGQTLTALGSYWKGRKPLVLVRATVLACLLPATDDPEGDLELFEMLMRMDHDGLLRRDPKVTASHVWASTAVLKKEKLDHIEPPRGEEATDDAYADADDDAEAPVLRGGGARWRPINLSQFDEAEAKAKEEGKLKLIVARATPDAERSEAVAAAKAEAIAALEEIKAQRDAERERIQDIRRDMMRRTFLAMPFSKQIAICERVEKLEDIQDPQDPLYAGIWGVVNARLGTVASSIPDLIEQLGIARFGRRPVVGDPFAGGGSIPFEAARVGCDVVASDLNPVAAMLTWGALNIIGADEATRARIIEEQRRVAEAVDAEIIRLGIEHNDRGDRAKAHLYCLEAVDPQTGWRVPMAPSWVISRSRRCVARLVPDHARKQFNIVVEENVSNAVMREAEAGTVRDGHLVYRVAPTPQGEEREWRLPITRLRGDGEGPEQPDGSRGNRLRPWVVSDVVPREPEWLPDAEPVLAGAAPGAWVGGDVWLECLYCIQWMDGDDLANGRLRPKTRFAAPDDADLQREAIVLRTVQGSLVHWQAAGFLPVMRIEPGDKTAEPIRTRGWTYWHHLFSPRHLLVAAAMRKRARSANSFLQLAASLNRMSRLSRWETGAAGPNGGPMDRAKDVFSNQALNTLYNYAARGVSGFEPDEAASFPLSASAQVNVHGASSLRDVCSLWIYDPPYADAVIYHEITEFFIAWLRKNPPPPFDEWTWDSRRPLAIQGKGNKFRADMVAAFSAMADHMPDNGLQVCMFTHKDAGVWADLAQIVWGAGLQVTAAWYVSTETISELKQGGYVQGTVLMVLRKRVGDEHGFRSDLVPEVRDRVAKQVATLTGLNQTVRGRGRDENVFSDADIQMAGYAAALEVLTAYTHIDGTDMTREALRPRDGRRTAEIGVVEEMIALAVQTANELMVPDGIAEGMWERLSPEERFYLKMTATEATWPSGQLGGKLDDYQNFARVYRAADWEDLMAERSPNKARLKGAAEFKRALMTGHPFAAGTIRPTLYAIADQWRATAQEEDPKTSGDRILHGLRDHFGLENWRQARDNVRALAAWFGTVWQRQRTEEAAAARVLAGLVGSEKLAG